MLLFIFEHNAVSLHLQALKVVLFEEALQKGEELLASDLTKFLLRKTLLLEQPWHDNVSVSVHLEPAFFEAAPFVLLQAPRGLVVGRLVPHARPVDCVKHFLEGQSTDYAFRGRANCFCLRYLQC